MDFLFLLLPRSLSDLAPPTQASACLLCEELRDTISEFRFHQSPVLDLFTLFTGLNQEHVHLFLPKDIIHFLHKDIKRKFFLTPLLNLITRDGYRNPVFNRSRG